MELLLHLAQGKILFVYKLGLFQTPLSTISSILFIIAKLSLKSTQLKLRLRLALFPYDPATHPPPTPPPPPAGKVRIQSSSPSTQSQINSTSTQTTELGTTQLKLVLLLSYASLMYTVSNYALILSFSSLFP